MKSKDLSAAIAYLASRPDVEPSRVGLLGVCTSGGNVVLAAAGDPKVRAVAAVVGHYAEPSRAPSFYDAMFNSGPETVDRFRREGKAARELYERSREIRWFSPTATPSARPRILGRCNTIWTQRAAAASHSGEMPLP
ncbi:MAG: dienelactone hydrolase family protein [Xanthobacteraceae bacterium]